MRIGLWIHRQGRLSYRRNRNTLQEACDVRKNPHDAGKNRGPGVLSMPDNRTTGLKAVSALGPEHVVSKMERIGSENVGEGDSSIQLIQCLEPDHVDGAVHAAGLAREKLKR